MTAPDVTRASGQECDDEPSDESDVSPPWIQKSEDGFADVQDHIIDGGIAVRHDDRAAFRLETFAVTRPDEVPVMVAGECGESKISARIELTPEQAEEFADVLVDQAAAARAREEAYSDG